MCVAIYDVETNAKTMPIINVFTWTVSSSFPELSVLEEYSAVLHGIMYCLEKSFVSLNIGKVYQNLCLFLWLRLRRIRYRVCRDVKEVHVLIKFGKID